MSQVCEQRLPADVPSCHSQGEAGRELDLHLQPTASTEKARQRARPRSPLFGESCSELPLIVTATSVAELLVLPNGGVAKFIRQRHELLDVLRERLHHWYHRVYLRTAPACAGEQERC
jgi:hypothetical protein